MHARLSSVADGVDPASGAAPPRGIRRAPKGSLPNLENVVDHDDYTPGGILYSMFDDAHRDRLVRRVAAHLSIYVDVALRTVGGGHTG
jgi:hypothetical protein